MVVVERAEAEQAEMGQAGVGQTGAEQAEAGRRGSRVELFHSRGGVRAAHQSVPGIHRLTALPEVG